MRREFQLSSGSAKTNDFAGVLESTLDLITQTWRRKRKDADKLQMLWSKDAAVFVQEQREKDPLTVLIVAPNPEWIGVPGSTVRAQNYVAAPQTVDTYLDQLPALSRVYIATETDPTRLAGRLRKKNNLRVVVSDGFYVPWLVNVGPLSVPVDSNYFLAAQWLGGSTKTKHSVGYVSESVRSVTVDVLSPSPLPGFSGLRMECVRTQ